MKRNLQKASFYFLGLTPATPLPSLAEQEAICAYLDAKLAEAKQIALGIETQIDTLTAYRKSLIHECVTGQRRITESDSTRSPQADVLRAQNGRQVA